MENGFNPWTNKKEKRKKEEPTLKPASIKQETKVESRVIKVIRQFKVKEDDIHIRIMEYYVEQKERKAKANKKYIRDYDKEAVARFMRKFNLTKEQAIEARNITKDKHRKKQWKNILKT